jgi:hypothetical protein
MAEEGKHNMTGDQRFRAAKDRYQDMTEEELAALLDEFVANDDMAPEGCAVLELLMERHPDKFQKLPDGEWMRREH